MRNLFTMRCPICAIMLLLACTVNIFGMINYDNENSNMNLFLYMNKETKKNEQMSKLRLDKYNESVNNSVLYITFKKKIDTKKASIMVIFSNINKTIVDENTDNEITKRARYLKSYWEKNNDRNYT